jgi:hypothetical protein
MLVEILERTIGVKMYSEREFSFTLKEELIHSVPYSAISGQK